jgi:lysophospholipase L1-like esterase
MQSFPARFAARSGAAGRAVTLDNPAVNGYSTRDLIDTELVELSRFQPTLVTLAIGANNIVRGGTAAQYREDVRLILRACIDAHVPAANIIAIPQPEWPRSPTGRGFGGEAALAQVRVFNDILRDEVRSIGGRWLDLTALMTQQADAAAWAPDGLHPNAASYDQWAEQLALLVR